MAAFTDDEKALVFEILGVPQGGTGLLVPALSRRGDAPPQDWEPVYAEGDFGEIVARITARLDATTEAQRTRARELLAQWNELAPTATLELRGATELDVARELDRIRAQLGNLLGVAVPRGGFVGEARRQLAAPGDR
jgi:hypothetical protein